MICIILLFTVNTQRTDQLSNYHKIVITFNLYLIQSIDHTIASVMVDIPVLIVVLGRFVIILVTVKMVERASKWMTKLFKCLWLWARQFIFFISLFSLYSIILMVVKTCWRFIDRMFMSFWLQRDQLWDTRVWGRVEWWVLLN